MFKKNTNTGEKNTGDYNSGDRNSGNRNSGYCNSGNYNSGDRNSGNRNSGDYNSGNSNSGNSNSGYCNSGYCNSGYSNSGNSNSGDYNSGNSNSGDFNTNEPNMRLFNKDTGKKRSEINIPYIYLKTNVWISENDMTTSQKTDDKDFHVKGGTLITRTYKEAWKLAWSEISEETRLEFLNLPNFDSEIFEEITGINVDTKKVSCNNKIVEIDGKKYKLTEV